MCHTNEYLVTTSNYYIESWFVSAIKHQHDFEKLHLSPLLWKICSEEIFIQSYTFDSHAQAYQVRTDGDRAQIPKLY